MSRVQVHIERVTLAGGAPRDLDAIRSALAVELTALFGAPGGTPVAASVRPRALASVPAPPGAGDAGGYGRWLAAAVHDAIPGASGGSR